MGYLGGGLLLAINIVMIQLLPGTWGARLSFLSVGIWWLVFSIPLFIQIPEPPAATISLASGQTIINVSFQRLVNTFRGIRQYRELFKFLLAFLIYIDGVGTIIGVAAIYGAELGFGSIELILALLLVQFVGIPYSLIFGRLPSKNEPRRAFYLAFVVFNLVALPLAGIGATRLLPSEISGTPQPAFSDSDGAVGEGIYMATDTVFETQGGWQVESLPTAGSRAQESTQYLISSEPGSEINLEYNGQNLEIIYTTGPDFGMMEVEIDGEPLLDESGESIMLDAYNPTTRYGVRGTLEVPEPGRHRISFIVSESNNPNSHGTRLAIASANILPPLRKSNLGIIIGLVFAVQIVGLVLSYLLGPGLFSGAVKYLDTKRSILLALLVYIVIALWGYFLNSVVEFWFLAWMVAVVQGGSQALSRSLFSTLSPAAKSGEFFGLFGIMEKFSAIFGPLVFAYAATVFGNSRPAVLSIIAFFFIGGYLLTRVNVDEGRKIAQAEDAALLPGASS
jgi:MFS-type transporter involved in bile tolerance (Atg22 family)